jgi:hypothetical protein
MPRKIRLMPTYRGERRRLKFAGYEKIGCFNRIGGFAELLLSEQRHRLSRQ